MNSYMTENQNNSYYVVVEKQEKLFIHILTS